MIRPRASALAAAVAVSLLAAAPAARAQPDALRDPGALPFLWLPLAAQLPLRAVLVPRRTPLGFSAREGGHAPPRWQVPGWSVTAAGGAVSAGLAAGGGAGRYHALGLVETLATGKVITALLKDAVGRHRPDWTPASRDPGERQSFPSGHATTAFAIGTYTAAYLHDHVFGPGSRLTEGLADAGLAAAAVTLAAERVLHHRHHVSDVVVGAGLGTLEALVFYRHQEGRYRDDRDRDREATSGVGLGLGLGLGGSF